MSHDHTDAQEQAHLTAEHQVLVLDGATQLLRRRLEEPMALELFANLVHAMSDLEEQLLHWAHMVLSGEHGHDVETEMEEN